MTYTTNASASLSELQVQQDASTAVVAGNRVELLSITGTLLGLASFVVLLRCLARQVMLRTFGLDDAAMILALIMAILGFTFFTKLVKAGGGKQANLLSAQEQEDFKFSEVMIGICCVVGICFVKISVGFFLRRFLQTRFLQRLVMGFISFIFVYMIYSVLTFIFMCTPTRSYWDDSVSGTCWSFRTLTIVGNLNAAINITTDFFTWALPVWVIIKLQLKKKTKITLVFIMSLGLFAVIASILRVFLGSAWQWSTDLYIWLNIEVDTAILAASLPCLRPIFRRFLGSTNEPSYPVANTYGLPTPGGRSGYARQNDSIALGSISRKGDSFKPFSKGGDDTYNANVTCEPAASRGRRAGGGGSGVLRDDGSSEDAILSPTGIVKTMETSVSVSTSNV